MQGREGAVHMVGDLRQVIVKSEDTLDVFYGAAEIMLGLAAQFFTGDTQGTTDLLYRPGLHRFTDPLHLFQF